MVVFQSLKEASGSENYLDEPGCYAVRLRWCALHYCSKADSFERASSFTQELQVSPDVCKK